MEMTMRMKLLQSPEVTMIMVTEETNPIATIIMATLKTMKMKPAPNPTVPMIMAIMINIKNPIVMMKMSTVTVMKMKPVQNACQPQCG